MELRRIGPWGWYWLTISAAALCAGAAIAAPKPPLPAKKPAVHEAAKETHKAANDTHKPAHKQAAKKTASKKSTAHASAPKEKAALLREVPLPLKRPHVAGHIAAAYAQDDVTFHAAPLGPHAGFKPLARPPYGAFAIASSTSTSAADMAALKQVIEAARRGRDADADTAERTITDPLARKLAEYLILRADNTNPPFARYAAFIAQNPTWPHAALFRRRAENALWNDKVDDATVLAFFAAEGPTTAKGRFVLAHALLAKGDRAAAAQLVRYAWRYQDCSADVESKVLEQYGDMLTRADHKVRMEQRFYEDDTEAGLRAAARLGGDQMAIANARVAVIRRVHNAKALLDAVPVSARRDAGYIFARAHWLRTHDQLEEAARLMLGAPTAADEVVDPDQWWQERRILVRALLDGGDPRTAYRIAREAATPKRGNYRVDKYFTAGWIALRFLHDPKTAAGLFAHIPEGTNNPHALARGGYWQGRAAEAMGQRAQATAYYEQAAHFTATYYGQLARGRLGLKELGLRGPPALTPQERNVLGNLEIVRAVQLLYALDQRDILASIYAELGESGNDVAGLAMLGEVAAKHNDGRAMVLLGQYAFGRGLPLDYYAYPVVGLPQYSPIAPPIERAVAYSIARQESHFNQKVVSAAHAMGLMQVTPAAGKDTAKRYKVTYNGARLLNDPVYNVQMGAAELSNLLTGYNGSYILTFAAYNAGRGRIRQWMEVYGDPRDPKVDPVDWVERIPFAETRNYVQRIMENLQVYRARFGGGSRLLIEADLRRGATN
jgi:soluble lytic murein transglycosylase